MLTGGAGSIVAILVLSWLLAGDMGETLTRNTVRLSLAWYAAALCLMIQLGADDWPAATGLGRLTRWCWTWAVICFLVHLVLAFHFYHHWSHADAFERTRRVSGSGHGIYTSYLFTLLWTADAFWWWCWPSQFAARSRWIDRALHAFMLFIVFNGMVVFETGRSVGPDSSCSPPFWQSGSARGDYLDFDRHERSTHSVRQSSLLFLLENRARNACPRRVGRSRSRNRS